MEQLLAEFNELNTIFLDIIPPQSIAQVKSAAESGSFLKKNLQVSLNVPVANSHSRVPATAILLCDISPSYPVILPNFAVQTTFFLASETENGISSELKNFISRKYSENKKQNFLVAAVIWVHNVDFPGFISNLHPKKTPSLTSARQYFYFHHLWSKAKRFELLRFANELSLKGMVVPGKKPGFLCLEGDTNDLVVLENRAKCFRWKEFKFMAQFGKQPTNSFVSCFGSLIEYVEPKWAELQKTETKLVEIVNDPHLFLETLREAAVPKAEVDIVAKYFP